MLDQLNQLFKQQYQEHNGYLLLGSYHDLESDLSRLSHQPQTFSALIGLYAYGALATNDLPYAQAIQEACAAFMANQKYRWLEDSMKTFPQCFHLVKKNAQEALENYQSGQFFHPSRIQTTAAIQSAFEAKLQEILGLRSEAGDVDAKELCESRHAI